MSDSTRNWILKEVLPLVVVVGGSVGGSVLWITNELADLRSDLSAEIADARSDGSAEIADARSDGSAEIADLRTNLSAEIADLRTNLSAEIADLRERVASIEGKLDLLISGLDIQVKVAAAP